MPRITKRTVEAIRPSAKDTILWDEKLLGFGVRVKPTGVRSYIVQYRNKYGRSKRLTIGRHGQITAEEARKEARLILGDAVRGRDAAQERKDLRLAPTVKELCGRFLDEHAKEHKKRSSIEADKRNIANHILPLLGQLKVSEITRADIDRFKRAVKSGKTARRERLGPRKLLNVKGGPGAANRCLALLSKMLNLAEKWDLRPDGSNPCRHIDRFKENKRERFLSEVELAHLAETLRETEKKQTESASVIAAIRLLLFTGARLSEILTLRWEHVDMSGQCLRIPDSKTGAKTIYLPPAGLEVLTDLDRHEDNPYVIAGAKLGTHLVNLQKPWRRIRAKAGLGDVRLHDLRHSFASMAVAGGLSLPVIGALLGHTQPATTARYAHLADDPLRQAVNIAGGRIAAAMGHVAQPKSTDETAS